MTEPPSACRQSAPGIRMGSDIGCTDRRRLNGSGVWKEGVGIAWFFGISLMVYIEHITAS